MYVYIYLSTMTVTDCCSEKRCDPVFFVLCVLRMLAPLVSPAPGEVVVRVQSVPDVVSLWGSTDNFSVPRVLYALQVT